MNDHAEIQDDMPAVEVPKALAQQGQRGRNVKSKTATEMLILNGDSYSTDTVDLF